MARKATIHFVRPLRRRILSTSSCRRSFFTLHKKQKWVAMEEKERGKKEKRQTKRRQTERVDRTSKEMKSKVKIEREIQKRRGEEKTQER